MKILAFTIGALLSLTSAVATAQPARERSLDLSIGIGGLLGGAPRTYRSTTGVAGDVMFSAPVGKRFRLGVSWSGQSGLSNTDDCIQRDPGTPGSGCRARLPVVSSWSALVSRDWLPSPAMAVRTSVGPSRVSVYRTKALSPSYWSSMGGVTVRLDVILPSRANIVLSLRGALVPAFPGANGTLAFGVGFGLH